MDYIEVFKTNLVSITDAMELKHVLRSIDKRLNIHFDLDDCDRIMRVKGPAIKNETIVRAAIEVGVFCEVLPD